MDDQLNYMPIPILLATCGINLPFDIYLKQGNSYILYSKKNCFDIRHRNKLYNNFVDTVYINLYDRLVYNQYIENMLPVILNDDSISLEFRSKLIYDHSIELSQNLFNFNNKELYNEDDSFKIENLVKTLYSYLSNDIRTIQSIIQLINHNYITYKHCINVLIYAMVTLISIDNNEERLKNIGMGCILHDVGKIKVPNHILNKPERLTTAEFEVIKNHPRDGIELCKTMNLSQSSLDCILLHHEKLDGKGYPFGLTEFSDDVKLVTICDIYDALTSQRPYGKVYTPFEAMKLILIDVEHNKIDKELYKIFVHVLSKNQFII